MKKIVVVMISINEAAKLTWLSQYAYFMHYQTLPIFESYDDKKI